MKRVTIIIMTVLAICHFSCNTAVESTTTEDNKVRGAAFEAINVEDFDSFMTSFEGIDTMDAVVKGKVESVCQKKGCWMNIVTTDGKQEMFVKFVDYGFFMPLDVSGKTVTMKGTAYREVTSVEELQHYAEDEGLPQAEIDAITEPKEEMKFMASGVIIGE